MINFTVKIYPQVIWGEKYRGNFASLVDDLVKAGISNIVVPAFQGSRIFFSQPVDSSANPWSLLPLKKLCKERELGFAIELPLFHDRDSFDKIEECTRSLKTPPSLIVEVPPAPTPHFAERLRRFTGIHLHAWRNLVQVISPQFFHRKFQFLGLCTRRSLLVFCRGVAELFRNLEISRWSPFGGGE